MVFKHHTNNFSAKKCTQKGYRAYTKMYSRVHKNVLRRTQKCTRAYIKMYQGMYF